MAKLTRKNLMIDEPKLRELAERRGLSESAAVREAIDHGLAAAEVMAAIREIHAAGSIDDVFGTLPANGEEAMSVTPAGAGD